MKKLIIIAVVFIILSCTSVISADFDNCKTKEGDTITITNMFCLGSTLADYKLKDYSKQCLIDCWAELEINTYTDYKLLDEIKTKDFSGQYILGKTYKMFIEKTIDVTEQIPQYKKNCSSQIINGSVKDKCEDVIESYKNETKKVTYWENYNGETLPKGNYKLRIETKKRPKEKIDFIPVAFGVSLNEWAWWDSNWAKKKLVTVTGGTGTINNIPIYLNVTYDSDMNATFTDLRFTNEAQSTEYDFEIDNKIDSNYAGIWVKIPTMTTGNNNLYMYYGNPTALSGEDLTAVWEDYVAVYHYSDRNWLNDSTQFKNNLTIGGGGSYPQYITGKGVFGGQANFTTHKVRSVANPKGTTSNNTRTIMTFLQLMTTGGNQQGYLSLGFANARNYYALSGVTGNWQLLGNGADYDTGVALDTNYNFMLAQHIQETDRTEVFKNGTRLGAGYDPAPTWNTADYFISIGDSYNNGDTWNGVPIKAVIDESRISNKTFSSEYINRTAQVSNFSLFGFGAEETSGAIEISLLYPPDLKFSNNNNQIFNFSIAPSGVNISNYTFYIWDNATKLNYSFFNNTFGTNFNTITNFTFYRTFTSDYDYNWSVWACGRDKDGVSACGMASNRSLTIDTLAPSISGVYNITNFITFSLPVTTSFNWTTTDRHMNNCMYNSSENATLTYATCNLPASNYNINWNSGGTKYIYYYGNDSAGNINVSRTSLTVTYLQLNQTINTDAYETETVNFITNVSIAGTAYNSVSATLMYDGTAYAGTQVSSSNNFTNFVKSLDIPLVNAIQVNRSVFWSINLYNGSSVLNMNTSSISQRTAPINLTVCSAVFPITALNFTAVRENNLSIRVASFNFYSTFEYYLGSGNIKKNTSIDNSGAYESSLCINPVFKNFTVSGIIEYGNDNLTYVTRNYYLTKDLVNNITQNITLPLLENTDATTFIIKVQNTNYEPLPDSYVFIQRYYPQTNSYTTVQVAKTDANGKTVGFYKTETVDYRHIIKSSNGTILLTTDKQKIFGETVPYTLTFTVGEDMGDVFEQFENSVGTLNYTLAYNNTNRIVTFSYTDTNTTFNFSEFYVIKDNPSGLPSTVCGANTTLASAVQTCNLSSYTSGHFTGKATIHYNSNVQRTFVISFDISDAISTFGTFGLFLGFFIIIVASLSLLGNVTAGAWVTTIALLFVHMTGLIQFNMLFLFGAFALCIIITIFRTRGGGYYA